MSPSSFTSSSSLKKSNRLELLAPAKNADFGIEAIKHGADAVYIGGPSFGARANAGNSINDIERLCQFAHKYHGQVFVALNTILTDSELAQAEGLIWQIYNAGADALIVQDMGILQLDLPPIALHASTQMDNRDPQKITFLDNVGFTQVVLARELNVDQIKTIAANTNMRIEFFIHGALCVSYSGQCYISQAFTGRSANRGECSQMCRLPCNLKNRQGNIIAENQHLLSLKDNNQTANLDALIDAGVRSFKIEGRLKDLSYVKNVTAHYRQQLDNIIQQRSDFFSSSHGRCQYKFKPDPDKSFNRGKTDYFVKQRTQDIYDFRTPKYLGEEVGKLVHIGKDFIELSSSKTFNNGDGLCYFTQNYLKSQFSDEKLNGLRINRVENNKLFINHIPNDLKKGMIFYRNFNKSFEDILAKESSQRLIDIRLILKDHKAGLSLELSDNYGHKVLTHIACEKVLANDIQKTKATIIKQLSKLGNTDFTAKHIDIQTSNMWFIPTSILNNLRRNGILAMEEMRLASYCRPKTGKVDPNASYPIKHLSYLANVANTQAKTFYQQHGVKNIDAAFEQNIEKGDVPLMITKHCLRYSFDLCPKQHADIKADPMELEIGGEQVKLVFDCKNCEMKIVGSAKRKNKQ